MIISPISISSNYKVHSFKANEQSKPQEKGQQEVQWSTWGENYAYPITKERNTDIFAGDVKHNKAGEDKKELNPESKKVGEESPEDYYRRKLYSTEWTT